MMDCVMEKLYSDFLNAVSVRLSGDRIYTDELRTFCWGTDAGFYRICIIL